MVPTRSKKETRRIVQQGVILFSLSLLFFSCGTEQEAIVSEEIPVNRWSTDEAWSVLQAQEKRDVGALCRHLQDSIWQIRRAAALAFASVRSGDAVSCLLPALNDREAGVRSAAAFALGLCGNTDEGEDMVDKLKFEHEPNVRYALWEGAGRIGDELTLNRLLYQETKEASDSLGLAWAMYAMALEGYLNDTAVTKCMDLLLSKDVAVRLGASHALGRAKSEQLLPQKQRLAKWLGVEPLSEVRLALLRAYGKITDANDLPILSGQFAKSNPLEQVNILRCLGKLSDLQSNLFLRDACTSENAQVAKTAVSVLSRRKDFDYTKVYPTVTNAVVHEEAKLELLAACLRKLPHSKSRFVHAFTEFESSSNPYIKAKAKAVALENGKASPLKAMARMAVDDSSSFIEKTAASQAAINWLERHPKLAEDEHVALSKLLNAKDPGVLADVAIFISSSAELKGNDPGKFAVFAEYSITQLTLPRDLEAKLMLENAIAHLKGEEAPEHVRPVFNHSIQRSSLNQLANGQLYVINTSKGAIHIRTFVDETPGSALAFDSLVTAGYYEGKSYHRVVPNFVAQGGCPRGDGYGSMDWTLRTEIGLSRYGTGSIGLASAGADTESCQFFFTHSPTPHLDGRYTRFGQVVEGMDVVNALEVGDQITTISRE